MLRLIFLAFLASVTVTNLTDGISVSAVDNFRVGKSGDIQYICSLFCDTTQYESFFFRTLDEMINPRIFCDLCKKKIPTTTTTTMKPKPSSTTSSTTSTSTSTTTTTTTTTMKPNKTMTT